MSLPQMPQVDPALAAIIEQMVNARLASVHQERDVKERTMQQHIDTLSESLATALRGSATGKRCDFFV